MEGVTIFYTLHLFTMLSTVPERGGMVGADTEQLHLSLSPTWQCPLTCHFLYPHLVVSLFSFLSFFF